MAMKTPGVDIVEGNAFPHAVVEVATAVPAFIGHTEMADDKGTSLAGKPWCIGSLAEYHQYFGFAPVPLFDIAPGAGGKGYVLTQPDGQAGGRYLLYYSIRLFYANGGGPCYIVSVGDYQTDLHAAALQEGLDSLTREQAPTMVLIPEAVLLAPPDCMAVQRAMLGHCGSRMRNRVAILDIREGWKTQTDSQCIANFRDSLGIDHLSFGAAYYPWVNTTIVQDQDLGFENISPASRAFVADNSGLFNTIRGELSARLNLLPPGAAMAGIYTMVDNSRGVWKAPANVSMNSVVSPAVSVSHEEQEDLNVTPQGKSINAIRSFDGEGVLVWGARTLDGNSLDWRYINVRRTMIMLEESCRLAASAMALEPNVASTWVTLKSMLGNFLTSVWKRGGLAGAAADDAFSVQVGLGETMTPEDILEGILRVTVLVAVTRPAEFIEITFQQQQPKPS